MSDTDHPSTPNRRWYQFSLRTLLMAMLAFCIFAGWVVYRRRQAQFNRDRLAALERAALAIHQYGGFVGYDEIQPPVQRKLRSRTWLEELFDDPGDVDDLTETIDISSASSSKKLQRPGRCRRDDVALLVVVFKSSTASERVARWLSLPVEVVERGL